MNTLTISAGILADARQNIGSDRARRELAKAPRPANINRTPASDIGSREEDGRQPEAPLPTDEGSYGREAAPETPRAIIKATPFVWIDPAAIPRRQWLYGRHYVRKYISETIAPGAYGKSTLVMTEALAIATGQALLGVIPDERTNVWMSISAEN
jgi:hypothetical protein